MVSYNCICYGFSSMIAEYLQNKWFQIVQVVFSLIYMNFKHC